MNGQDANVEDLEMGRLSCVICALQAIKIILIKGGRGRLDTHKGEGYEDGGRDWNDAGKVKSYAKCILQ